MYLVFLVSALVKNISRINTWMTVNPCRQIYLALMSLKPCSINASWIIFLSLFGQNQYWYHNSPMPALAVASGTLKKKSSQIFTLDLHIFVESIIAFAIWKFHFVIYFRISKKQTRYSRKAIMNMLTWVLTQLDLRGELKKCRTNSSRNDEFLGLQQIKERCPFCTNT